MKTRVPQGSNAASLMKIASEIDGLAPMSQNLEISKFVPTIFPSFNRAIVLGGAPLGCIYTIHGPQSHGKSSLAVGLMASFARNGHVAAFIDAEHSADVKWFTSLGLDPTSILYYRPDFLEDTSDMFDALVANFDEAKSNGTIPEDKGMIIVVDSVNKLTPKSEYQRFVKEGGEAMDKGLARFRGLAIQTWLDHVTPIVGKRDIALVCIAQEREVKGAKPWEPEFRVKGCQGLGYDSSVQIRVVQGEKIWEGKEKKKKTLVGDWRRFYVIKNKVGYPREVGEFCTGNGKGAVNFGFDHAMIAFREATKYRSGIITQNGAWYYYDYEPIGEKFKWNGEAQAIAALKSDPHLLTHLQTQLNQQVWDA